MARLISILAGALLMNVKKLKNKIIRVYQLIQDGQLVHYAKNRVVSYWAPHSIPIGNNYIGLKAQVYDTHREKDEYWIAEDRSLLHFLNVIGPIRNVLDAPFGTGRFAPLYYRHNMDIIALDISQDMIDQAIKKYPAIMENAKIHVQDMSSIPYSDKAIDLVVCYRFLPWIVTAAEARTTLGELARVCRKYAILEFCVGKHQDGSRKIYPDKTLWDRMNERELRRWLKQFNLNVLEIISLYDDSEHPGLSAFLCQKLS